MIFSSIGLGSHSKNIPPDSWASMPRSGHSSGKDFWTQTGGEGGVGSSISKPQADIKNEKCKVKSAKSQNLVRAPKIIAHMGLLCFGRTVIRLSIGEGKKYDRRAKG